MLTWALLWFCWKTKSDPQFLVLIAIVADAVIFINLTEAMK